jgi:hypothetical protein
VSAFLGNVYLPAIIIGGGLVLIGLMPLIRGMLRK